MSLFLSTPYWQQLAGAAFLELPELAGKRLTDLRSDPGEQDHASQFDMATLKGQGFTDEQVRQFLEMQAQLMDSKRRDKEASSPARITRALVERTGVPEPVWQRSGKEMLEAVLPIQSSNTQEIPAMESDSNGGETIAADSARSMGFERITLIADFPITRATFGFSRVDYQPQKCQLNPFSPDRDHEGRYPVFVDIVQADALSIRLNPVNVWRWLELNGLSPNFPESASDQDLAKRAYFIGLLDETLLGETLRADRAEERMVFGLLHTLSHLAIRQAALLCGLDSTSLSEYILPKALTFSLYCNHRFGATIGALASLFEQSLGEWLQAIREADRCVYDPVCGDRGGSCHACTHLSETSCRFFNLNLGRSLLFGGHDPELGKINYGYFDIK
ncbi:MAG: hypothetical protein F4Y84_07240 [Caldilineaceae bacterium SB0665_bin_25]|nr:hypothetical protein [Caldilineaceae bacterium SB0665_bin_25]